VPMGTRAICYPHVITHPSVCTSVVRHETALLSSRCRSTAADAAAEDCDDDDDDDDDDGMRVCTQAERIRPPPRPDIN